MKIDFINEPDLKFGWGNHIDIRFGIMEYGVLDYDDNSAPRKINIGLIGLNRDMSSFIKWVEKCKNEIPAKESKQPNLFPKFCGFNKDCGFFSEIVFNENLNRQLLLNDIRGLKNIETRDEAVEAAVDIFLEEIQYIQENDKSVDVIVCVIPVALLEVMSEFGKKKKYDFHNMLKAKAMGLKQHIQLVLPTTFDSSIKIKKKIKVDEDRTLQDEATRAWNFFTGIYYKAGGTPYRVSRKSSDYTTCFIGISFYRSLDKSQVQTSVAQVFNERGEGIIVRGANATFFNEDKQYHLEMSDAQSLLERALKKYRDEHKTYPARVIIHKSSSFNADEIVGFSNAIDNRGIAFFDFISMRSSLIRLFRRKMYPPLRGTFAELDEENTILYTRGSVDFYQTYPGMYVPRSLLLKTIPDFCQSNPKALATEILSLTKMNWNNTQFDEAEPITLTASRKVGAILKYLGKNDKIEARYSYYM